MVRHTTSFLIKNYEQNNSRPANRSPYSKPLNRRSAGLLKKKDWAWGEIIIADPACQSGFCHVLTRGKQGMHSFVLPHRLGFVCNDIFSIPEICHRENAWPVFDVRSRYNIQLQYTCIYVFFLSDFSIIWLPVLVELHLGRDENTN